MKFGPPVVSFKMSWNFGAFSWQVYDNPFSPLRYILSLRIFFMFLMNISKCISRQEIHIIYNRQFWYDLVTAGGFRGEKCLENGAAGHLDANFMVPEIGENVCGETFTLFFLNSKGEVEKICIHKFWMKSGKIEPFPFSLSLHSPAMHAFVIAVGNALQRRYF